MKSKGRKQVNEYTIESLLDRMACLDPSKFGQNISIEDDDRKGFKLKESSRLSDERRSNPRKSHQILKAHKSSQRGRLQVCKYLPSVTSTLPTASVSNDTPWLEDNEGWSSESSESSDSCDSSDSEENYDDKINLVIKVKKGEKERSPKAREGRAPKATKERPPAIAPVVPTPTRSVKTMFVRPQAKPFGSPITKDQRKTTKLDQKWKGKTVQAARCVGPF